MIYRKAIGGPMLVLGGFYVRCDSPSKICKGISEIPTEKGVPDWASLLYFQGVLD